MEKFLDIGTDQSKAICEQMILDLESSNNKEENSKNKSTVVAKKPNKTKVKTNSLFQSKKQFYKNTTTNKIVETSSEQSNNEASDNLLDIISWDNVSKQIISNQDGMVEKTKNKIKQSKATTVTTIKPKKALNKNAIVKKKRETYVNKKREKSCVENIVKDFSDSPEILNKSKKTNCVQEILNDFSFDSDSETNEANDHLEENYVPLFQSFGKTLGSLRFSAGTSKSMQNETHDSNKSKSKNSVFLYDSLQRDSNSNVNLQSIVEKTNSLNSRSRINFETPDTFLHNDDFEKSNLDKCKSIRKSRVLNLLPKNKSNRKSNVKDVTNSFWDNNNKQSQKKKRLRSYFEEEESSHQSKNDFIEVASASEVNKPTVLGSNKQNSEEVSPPKKKKLTLDKNNEENQNGSHFEELHNEEDFNQEESDLREVFNASKLSGFKILSSKKKNCRPSEKVSPPKARKLILDNKLNQKKQCFQDISNKESFNEKESDFGASKLSDSKVLSSMKKNSRFTEESSSKGRKISFKENCDPTAHAYDGEESIQTTSSRKETNKNCRGELESMVDNTEFAVPKLPKYKKSKSSKSLQSEKSPIRSITSSSFETSSISNGNSFRRSGRVRKPNPYRYVTKIICEDKRTLQHFVKAEPVRGKRKTTTIKPQLSHKKVRYVIEENEQCVLTYSDQSQVIAIFV